MKRQIKKIVQWTMILGIMVVTLSACGDLDGEEIFDNVELEMEQLTEDEERKASKPG